LRLPEKSIQSNVQEAPGYTGEQQAKRATSPGCMGEQQAKRATSPGCMGEQQAKRATSPDPKYIFFINRECSRDLSGKRINKRNIQKIYKFVRAFLSSGRGCRGKTMKKINQENLDSAYEFIKTNCNDLHKTLFEYDFLNGDPNKVVNALRKYQNEDGGFGHGLEPDFILPNSSPISTTIAFQILNDIEQPDQSIIKKAVKFYEDTFDKNRNGWWSVPSEVNDYPHAPWWHYNKREKCTIIDKHWGNPSSEIIGILFEYREYLEIIDIEKLIDYAVTYLHNLTEFKSEHEIYCYIRMYKKLPKQYQDQLQDKISLAIKELICLDETKWDTYVPKPFEFIQSKKHPLFREIEEHADKNCDYLIDTIENSVWYPTWKWNDSKRIQQDRINAM
jgi:hypothetical protein